ncbi:hypothetical protein RhiirC2_808957 [Rhizophagus irregularis]|uniref:Uncharacterized protein n=1 Tax=Rhizophagus irregularis TaxID=588596 RepID=A0A2N1MUV6_9GLOM|nr:hypothetical protein RhiirC2_808957 [Rhizophagus irregularis]
MPFLPWYEAACKGDFKFKPFGILAISCETCENAVLATWYEAACKGDFKFKPFGILAISCKRMPFLSHDMRSPARFTLLPAYESEDEVIMVETNGESEDDRETQDLPVEEDDLYEPSVIRINEDSSEETFNWNTIKEKVDTYRKQLKKGKYAVDTLYYFLIDYSGFHGPTSNLLSGYFPKMLNALPKNMRFCVSTLSEEETKFFDLLLRTEDIADVKTVTEEEKILKRLANNIFDAITMHGKDDLSEFEHTSRNIIPLLDATIRKDNHYRVKYGETSLEATANRRNKGTDPNDRARIGYKVDVIFEYREIRWIPVIGCMEVSGGLPRCSRSKEWDDTRKLGLELRDLWLDATEKLADANANEIVWWGLTVVGLKIRVYALAAAGGLFHLVLMYECLLPSSPVDLVNLELAYLVLKEYKKKLDETRDILCKLNQERIKLITRGKRGSDELLREVGKKPEIINTPEPRKRSRQTPTAYDFIHGFILLELVLIFSHVYMHHEVKSQDLSSNF